MIGRLVLAVLFALCAGCSCSADPGNGGDGGSSRDATAQGLDASGLDAARPDAMRPDATASAEVCDRIDNDRNGIIDDIDVGGDGVCDCLSIATLGVRGNAGVGDVFESWLRARSTNGVVDLANGELTAEVLAPFQVIVAQNVSGGEYSDEEVAALDAWIRGGGGFMTLIGYADPSERTNANRMLASSGLSYGPDPVLYVGGSTAPVTTWHPHPVSEMVTRLGADNGYAVLGGGTLIAEEGGVPMLRAVELGQGRVLVWGDEWITFDSEWTGHPDYQVERFWLNALKWLSPPTECQVPILI
ncbi:MAG: hypothetical protein K8H88_32275 [Sandaracinaceae bacterium]|nr:hypothetical protein [Sandaracinaceae bacterium]